MTNVRLERKLGRDFLQTVADIMQCPQDNLKQFQVLERRLTRLAKNYQDLTGSEKLLHTPDFYGFEERRHEPRN